MSRADLQYWLRRQQAWCDFRNAQAIGWREVWRRAWIWPRILRTAPMPTPPCGHGAPLELQVMCHAGDWLAAVWMLKSLERVAGAGLPLTLHCQNELKPSALAHLRRMFPGARVIEPAEATARVGAHLVDRGLPRCLLWRQQARILQKLVDIQVFSHAGRLLCLDPDVLFFARPDRLLDAGEGTDGEYLFQRDEIDGYTASRGALRQATGVDLLPGLNAGIVLRPHDALDLAEVESWLAVPEVARASGHLEQTLQALSACAHHRAGFLPPEYCLDLRNPRDCAPLACRHYAGPSRRWFTVEGVAWLRRAGLT